MSRITVFKGIYYTIYSNYAHVGNLTGEAKNGLNDYSLTILNIPDKVDNVPVTEIQMYAFYGANWITSVTIPSTVIKICDHAFDMMKFTNALTLPPNLEYIGERCFSGSLIKSINIPATVSHMGSSPFGSCNSLTSITIDKNNKHYHVTEGNYIYSIMDTVLVQVPPGSPNITLKPTVTDVGFYGIISITNEELEFPATFSYFKNASSVIYCSNLKTVRFLGNLVNIPNNAFNKCENLQNIYYYGIKAVKVAMFSTNPSNVYVCAGYKAAKFANIIVIRTQDPCPYVNYIKICTHCIQKRKTLNHSVLVVISLLLC